MKIQVRYKNKNICEKALTVQKKLDLSDLQTQIYDYLCRRDFYIYNNYALNNFIGENNYSKEYVKKLMSPLVEEGLIKFDSQVAPRDGRYRIWHWYDSSSNYTDLVCANGVSSHLFFKLKDYLNLPDGFDRNGTYGDIQFIRKIKYQDKNNNIVKVSDWKDAVLNRYSVSYSFKYKDNPHRCSFYTDHRTGVPYQTAYDSFDSTKSWLSVEDWEKDPYLYESDFDRLIHRICQHIMWFDKTTYFKLG